MPDNMTYGGFLGLEPKGITNSTWSFPGMGLSLGRHCFSLILRHLGTERVFLPYYICDSMLEVPKELQIEVEFYGINDQLEPVHPIPSLSEKEAFVYVNYFGLKSSICNDLISKFGSKLILDCSQALRLPSRSGVWAFNSLRKFVGLPDGAFFSGPESIPRPDLDRANPNHQFLDQRRCGRNAIAFQAFQKHECALTTLPRFISKFSEDRAKLIDWEGLVRARKQNFEWINNKLSSVNELNIKLSQDDIPLYYPLLITNDNLRAFACEKGLYIPQLWKEVFNRKLSEYEWEKHLCSNLLPLPIDQRYDLKDMEEIVRKIKWLICDD